jgi:TPR repeat protein
MQCDRGVLEDCVTAYEGKNYAAALQPCLSLAERGDARAQLSLGGMYYNGQGVRQDYTEAAKWTRKAAEQGYTPRKPTSASFTGMVKGCSKTLF